jgi:hypothetical protein
VPDPRVASGERPGSSEADLGTRRPTKGRLGAWRVVGARGRALECVDVIGPHVGRETSGLEADHGTIGDEVARGGDGCAAVPSSDAIGPRVAREPGGLRSRSSHGRPRVNSPSRAWRDR